MKVRELAASLKLETLGNSEMEISAPAPIESAGPGHLTFLAQPRYAPHLERLADACVILPVAFTALVKGAALISSNPYLDFARALEILLPPFRPMPEIDETARIGYGAKIGSGSSIGANCVIGAGVEIGRNAVIFPNVTIYPGVRIGDEFLCHSQVSIRETVTIGNRVTVHNGAVIGSDGFGYARHPSGLAKIPQVGGVIVEDDVELGANVTIDRATMGMTIIKQGAKLDNLVHIAHNCEIGAYTSCSAQVGISGSVKIGEWCVIGGQAGAAGHLRLGDRVQVAAQSGIHSNVQDGKTVAGYPAIEICRWRRLVAAAPRLPELIRRIRKIEQRLGLAAGTVAHTDSTGNR